MRANFEASPERDVSVGIGLAAGRADLGRWIVLYSAFSAAGLPLMTAFFHCSSGGKAGLRLESGRGCLSDTAGNECGQ